MPWLPVLHSVAGELAFFTHIVSEQHLEVAETDGEVVGFCSTHDGWIEQLYIHPDHQGRGLGSAFMTRAKARNDALQLWAFEQNTEAQGFYASHGFVVVERTDGRNNEEKCPDVRMTWTKGGPDD